MMLSFDLLNGVLFFLFKAAAVLLIVRWLVEQSRDLPAACARDLFAVAVLVVSLVPLLTPIVPVVPLPVISGALVQWLNVPLVEHVGDGVNYNAIFLSFFSVYLLMAAWQLFYILLGLAQIASVSRRSYDCTEPQLQEAAVQAARQLELKRVPHMRISNAVVSPQVWGWRRPIVLLPLESVHWEAGRQRRVLTHEFAHIKRHDWLLKILLRGVAALFWFVPFIHAAVQRSAWYAELACDDRVVQLEGERAAYANDLLSVSHCVSSDVVSAFIERSNVFQRVQAVLDGTRNRVPASPADRFRYAVIACLLLLPLASVQAVVHEAPASNLQGMMLTPLIVQFPVPDAQKNVITNSNSFHPAQMELLRERPASPPVVEEVISVAPLLDFTAPTLESQYEPHLTMVIHPQVTMASLVKQVTVVPDYPRGALARGVEGQVIVRFDVNSVGEVINPRIVRSEPHGVFDEAVLSAVTQFRYRPQRVAGESVITKNITETYVFQVNDGTTDNLPQPKQRTQPEVTP